MDVDVNTQQSSFAALQESDAALFKKHQTAHLIELWRRYAALAVVFLVLIAIAALTYFPATQIAIDSNDQLDSFIPSNSAAPPVWQTIFDPQAKSPVIGGLSLNMLAYSEIDPTRLIYSLLPDYSEISWHFLAMVISLFVSFAVAMFALVQIAGEGKLVPIPNISGIAVGAGFLALLPHAITSIAPLICLNLFAAAIFLIIKGGFRGSIILLLATSAFFGDVAGGMFIYLAAFFALSIPLSIWKKSFAPIAYATLAIAFTIIADYRTFYGFLFSGEATHRSDWFVDTKPSFDRLFNIEWWGLALHEADLQIFGRPRHYHYQWNTENATLKLVGIGVACTVLLELFALVKTRQFSSQVRDRTRMLSSAAMILVACFIVAVLYGVLSQNLIPISAILKISLQFERMYIILPLLASTAVVFGTSPVFMATRSHIAQTALAVLAVAVLALTIHTPTARKFENLRHFRADATNPYVPHYTVGTYYKRGLFNAIKELVGSDWRRERVVTINEDPMIALYNDFIAMDGYFFQYPESYQTNFRAIIAPALDRLPEEARLFKEWGSRFGPKVVQVVEGKLDAPISGCAFKALGGTLVISFGELLDPSGSQLAFIDSVEAVTDGLPAKVHLYRPLESCPSNS